MNAEIINDKTTENPWLSIIVPINNSEKYLHKSLETSDKKPTVKETIVKILKKVYKTI